MYLCGSRRRRDGLKKGCNLNLPAGPIDATFSERLAGAITPMRIELALAALTALEERDQAIGAQWRMRIDRARYDAELAERRYEAVDPTNRLIAATLEQRWNEALQRLSDLKAELGAFEKQNMRTVTAEQKAQILALRKTSLDSVVADDDVQRSKAHAEIIGAGCHCDQRPRTEDRQPPRSLARG